MTKAELEALAEVLREQIEGYEREVTRLLEINRQQQLALARPQP